MKNSVKKMIFGILDLYYNATFTMENNIKFDEKAGLLSLLSNANNSVDNLIEDVIKNYEEIDFTSLENIKKLCRELYEKTLADNADVDILNDIRDEIKKFRNIISIDIKTVYEIIFMPHSLNTWFYMEKVWHEASNDENCICYVVPINYYEVDNITKEPINKNDIALYPSNVTVYDCNTFDFEGLKPDAIYTNYPFEKDEKLTVVNERFSNENLKKHTETLIYLPYFWDNRPANDVRANMPSYKFFDKIIMYNEQSKINIHNKLGRRVSKKVVVFDYNKYKFKSKNDLIISKKKYGAIGKRKVCFFNTSLFNVYTNTDMLFEKVEKTIHIMDSFKKKIFFVWRPHPLLGSALKSIGEDEYNRYLQLKNLFLELEVGIIEEGRSFEQIMHVSDFYLGGGDSSIKSVFQSNNKQVIVLNYNKVLEVPPAENMVMPISFVKKDNMFYFLNAYFNAIMSFDENTNITEIFLVLDTPFFNDVNLYSDIILENDTFYLIPDCADNVKVIDFYSKEIKTIYLPFDEYMTSKFCAKNYYVHNDSVFVFPDSYRHTLKISLSKREISYIECDDYPYDITFNENAITEFNTGRVRLFSNNKSNTVFFNADDETFSVFNQKSRLGQAGYSVYCDDIFYVALKHNKKIIKFDKFNNIIGSIDYSHYEEIEEKSYVKSIINFDKYLLVFFTRGDLILKVDKKTDEISSYSIGVDFKFSDRKYNDSGILEQSFVKTNISYVAKKDENLIVLFCKYNNSLVEVNVETNEIRSLEMTIKNPNVVLNKIKQKKKDDIELVCYETNLLYSLSEILNKYLKSRTLFKKSIDLGEKLNLGKAIHLDTMDTVKGHRG